MRLLGGSQRHDREPRRVRRGRGERPSLPLAAPGLVALIAAGLGSACTEDPLATSPGASPGTSSPTVEFLVRSSELDLWFDTTVIGFARPNDAFFSIVAEQDDLVAHLLGRLPLPDTLTTFSDTLPADSFPSADVRVAIDTDRSTFGELPLTLTMYALERGFDENAVSWEEARTGEPWTTPGGDLGVRLASTELTVVADSLVFEFEVPVDSLLKAWTDADGEPGFAIVLETPGPQLQIRQILLRYEAILEGRESPISFEQPANPRTFITTPSLPPTGLGLRIGGLPASRAYFTFVPPDTIDGVPVRGSVVSAARLLFFPLEEPAAPFALARPLLGRPIELLADVQVFGEKTPIGGSGDNFVLDPDSLAAGVPLRIDVTAIMDIQASLPPDSVLPVRLGLRAEPDGQVLGYWELASGESPPERQPALVIILTPPPDFRLPQ